MDMMPVAPCQSLNQHQCQHLLGETPAMAAPAPEKPMEAPMPTEAPAPETMDMGGMK